MDPPEAILRVLVLLPLWGVWALMAPLHFCRLADDADALLAGFASQPVLATAACMAVPLAGTLWWYSQVLGGWASLPALAGLLAGGPLGSLLCRRGGGLNRRNLLAGSGLTQLLFLVAYVAAKELLITWH